MKKLLQILIALILLNNISTQISAQTTCKPLFKSIYYNYNVGDIYTYKETNYFASGDGWTVTSSFFFSFEIKNKIVKNDSLIYIIDGSFPATSITKENYSFESFTNTDTNIDTIVLIDSLSHILNLCSDTIVEFVSSPSQKYFAKALINPQDSSQKILGGVFNNNFFILSNGEFVRYINFTYEERYTDSLGLIYKDELGFENETIIELASYIKGGDTTIIISSIENPVIIEKSISVYPNPAAGNVLNLSTYNTAGDNAGINIIDLQGRVWYAGNTASEVKEIDISSLPAGLYIVQVVLKEKVMQQKFIKQ